MAENSGIPFKITPQFVFEMILRRRWIILIPMGLALIAGIWLAFYLPKIYEAKTLIIIEGQRVPQNYVRSIVTDDPAQRIATISQQILSTSNLEKIITNFGLFSGPEYQNAFLEDKVTNLRQRISVNVMGNRRETEAFTITFKGRDPKKVMLVANGLASNFIEENIRNRESQATGTSQFLDSQLEAMRKKLEELEENIKNYRKSHMGELPEQLDTNLRIMERLQENLTAKQQQLREAKIRLGDLQNQTKRNQGPLVVIEGSGRTNQPTGASLEDLRAELEALRARYTEEHPDIQRLKSRIAELESEQKHGSGDKADRHIPRALRAQIQDAQREIQVTESELRQISNQIAVYQERVEDTPKREQELLGLKRDYQNIQASYDSLLNRKLEADIAVNMERKQKGEQFRVVDPARLPQRPVEPDMRRLFIMVVALGLGLGAGISFLTEILNVPFRAPDDIESLYGKPVLTTIPFMKQRKDILLQRLNNAMSIAFTGIVCILLMVFGVISLNGPEIVGSVFH